MARKSSSNPWPEVLKALRERTGWTQTDAANEAMTTLRSWSRWETGVREPVGPTVVALKCLVERHAKHLLEKLPE